MKPKTYKREVAFLLLIFLCVVAWMAAKVAPVETLKVIVWPIMVFAGAAWGMEWASKQANLTGAK